MTYGYDKSKAIFYLSIECPKQAIIINVILIVSPLPGQTMSKRQFGERDWRRLGGLLRGASHFAQIRQTVELPDAQPAKSPEVDSKYPFKGDGLSKVWCRT